MQRRSSFPYKKIAWILATLFILLSLGTSTSLSFKNKAVSLTSKIFPAKSNDDHEALEEQLQKLQVEKHLLELAMERLTQQIHAAPPQVEAIPAHIIHRSPEHWNSTCWIDVGEAYNTEHHEKRIAKGNPVLVGKTLVGIIDHVDETQSLVRWITDPAVTPSVRVKRKEGETTSYLAKGYLKGTGEPLWRSRGRVLEGTGFNYDFTDEYGEGRDLRTLRPEPLILVDDLLVTTGMDGIFPPDLEVAIVTEIKNLREGDYFYEIKATPAAGKMEELSLVFVLPHVVH